MQIIITLIRALVQVFDLAMVVYIITTFFLPFDHPFRRALARFFEPLLNPIRNVIHPFYGIDFSPAILLLLVYFLELFLTQILGLFV